MYSKEQAQYEKEYREIETRYFNKDGSEKQGAMLAPNGERSKLSKHQWIQVRTASFKNWFGDWEQSNVNAFIDKSLTDKQFKGILTIRPLSLW